MLAETLGAAVTLGAATLAYAVRAPRSSMLAPSVFRGPSTRKAVALTFDDGPSESTPALLDLLGEHDARATFFEVGANVRRLPKIARRVAEAGHEIGNHTESHAMLALRSAGFIMSELSAAQATIEDATGVRPRLFRAPYGVRWFGLEEAQRRLGLAGVTWTVIGLDWKLQAAEVAARIERGIAPGAIICLHDGREASGNPDISVTIEAVRRVLGCIKDQGFRMETVSDLLCPKN